MGVGLISLYFAWFPTYPPPLCSSSSCQKAPSHIQKMEFSMGVGLVSFVFCMVSCLPPPIVLIKLMSESAIPYTYMEFSMGVGLISLYFAWFPTYPPHCAHQAHVRKRHPIYLYGIFNGGRFDFIVFCMVSYLPPPTSLQQDSLTLLLAT